MQSSFITWLHNISSSTSKYPYKSSFWT